MADPFRYKAVGTWYASGVGTSLGATVTKAAIADRRFSVTHLAVSGDAAALLTLTWTDLELNVQTWKRRYAQAFVDGFVFPPGAIQATTNTAITLVISASTANCEANIGGDISK